MKKEMDKYYIIMYKGVGIADVLRNEGLKIVLCFLIPYVLVIATAYLSTFENRVEIMYPIVKLLVGCTVIVIIALVLYILSLIVNKTRITAVIFCLTYIVVGLGWVNEAMWASVLHRFNDEVGYFMVILSVSIIVIGCIIEFIVLEKDIKDGVYEKKSNKEERRLPWWCYVIVFITFAPILSCANRMVNARHWSQEFIVVYCMYIFTVLDVVISRALLKLCIYLKNYGKLSAKEKQKLLKK